MKRSHSRKDANRYGTFTSPASHARSGGSGASDRTPLTDTPESTCEKYTSCRWTLAYLGGWVNLMLFCLRNCISMAIVCMSDLEGEKTVVEPMVLDNGTVSGENVTTASFVDLRNGTAVVVVAPGPEYIPQSMQGVVLSSYYYGYILTPFLGGMVAARFGVKRVLTVSMVMSAAFTLLMPVAVRFNIYLTVALRILLGFVAGVTLPASTMMWTHWAPPHEKGKLVTITLSGSSTGSIVANLVSGFLCAIPLDEGWPFIFYLYGVIAVLWVIMWQFLAYDTPDKHPRVSAKERAVIGSTPKTTTKVSMRPPLKAMFSCIPFYAMILAHMADSWFVNFVSTYLPLYLSDVLLFDTETSGVLASLPFISRVLLNMVFAVISDRLHIHGLLSVTNNRKLFQTVGLVLPGAMLVGLGYLDSSQRSVSVAMFVILSGLESASQLGFRLTPLDIAPRFAGPLTGLSVTFGTAAQIICPLVTSAIIADNRPESWATVFIITGVVCFAGAVVFLVAGSGVEQEWAKDRKPLFARYGQSSVISGPPGVHEDWLSAELAAQEISESQKSNSFYRDNYIEILASGEH
ncbi:hypothetical protein BaRGS_00022625 [Batillaria attramentaria]|uniref:Major facilitator superfamily (MFS) profile domain-containing protein n=1 Tax=Batillaria attramentaria TaxID=370345 RepID=A0ABD0KGB9_9CAEN